MLREKENQVSTGDMGSGTMEYILPYDTPLKPRCRPRYAVRIFPAAERGAGNGTCPAADSTLLSGEHSGQKGP